MGGMLTEVQQTLGENPLYHGLDFSGQNVNISQPVFHDLAVQVIRWADTHGGHMPTGTQPLGHFSDWLRWRWEVAVLSGHEDRFDTYHCPTLVTTVHHDYELNVVPSPPPPVQPPPFVPPPPPVIPVTIPLPPVTPPTEHTTLEHPSCPDHGAVPEPASVTMMSISLVAMGLLWLVFCIGRKPRVATKA